MKEYILENNLKVIYKETDSELTSICISIGAGASKDNDKLGIAHATEHLIYKATKKRTEAEINKDLGYYFCFQNAMTNYPYVIYYGTLLKQDFEYGIELFSDILLNPLFSEQGFNEEMKVIKEELDEWDNDLDQYCEDKLLYNCITSGRIKYPIIGKHSTLDNITINDVKGFYEENYFPENTSIVISSSMSEERALRIVEKYFHSWKSRYKTRKQFEDEVTDSENKLIQKTFSKQKAGINTCKVQIVMPIGDRSFDDITKLKIFDYVFSQGVNSVLYNSLRTENGLIYDVLSSINYENSIKLYKISFSTNINNLNKALTVFKECVDNIEKVSENISHQDIKRICHMLKVKRLFNEEKSINIVKELATYDTMYNDYDKYYEVNDYEQLFRKSNFIFLEALKENIFEVGKDILSKRSIQIIKPIKES